MGREGEGVLVGAQVAQGRDGLPQVLGRGWDTEAGPTSWENGDRQTPSVPCQRHPRPSPAPTPCSRGLAGIPHPVL